MSSKFWITYKEGNTKAEQNTHATEFTGDKFHGRFSNRMTPNSLTVIFSFSLKLFSIKSFLPTCFPQLNLSKQQELKGIQETTHIAFYRHVKSRNEQQTSSTTTFVPVDEHLIGIWVSTALDWFNDIQNFINSWFPQVE